MDTGKGKKKGNYWGNSESIGKGTSRKGGISRELKGSPGKMGRKSGVERNSCRETRKLRKRGGMKWEGFGQKDGHSHMGFEKPPGKNNKEKRKRGGTQ